MQKRLISPTGEVLLEKSIKFFCIDPTKDLPEVEDAKEFSMDVWRGGDKQDECKVKLTENSIGVEGPEKFEIL